MTLNSGLNLNFHFTCLVYLPNLEKLLDQETINLTLNCTYPNDKKLNVKL